MPSWRLSLLAAVACTAGVGLNVTLLRGALVGELQPMLVFAIVTLFDGICLAVVWLWLRRAQDAESRAAELATLRHELQLAKLDALGSQLKPHFLFNSLQVVSHLVFENPRRADRALLAISELLRELLDSSQERSVSLGRELDLADRFLTFHRDYSGRSISIHKSVDPMALDASIPPLLLQPLFENAVVHGAETASGKTRIEWIVRRYNADVRIEVHNSGRLGPAAPITARAGGVGLPNTAKRLRLFFGADHQFELRRRISGGAVASILIPYRPHHETEAERTAKSLFAEHANDESTRVANARGVQMSSDPVITETLHVDPYDDRRRRAPGA